VVEPVEVGVMAGFLRLDKAVIDRLPMRNQILAGKEPMALSRQGKNLLRVRLMPFDTVLFDEPMAAKMPNVAFHALTVTAIGEPSQIVSGNHAKLPYINKRLDLGLPQGILSVAAAIDCSRAVPLRPSGFLVPSVIRPPWPILTSPTLFRPSAVRPGVAIFLEYRLEIRNVIRSGHFYLLRFTRRRSQKQSSSVVLDE
jgi:hypothetical protein